MWYLKNHEHHEYCYQEKIFSDVECDEIIAMGCQNALIPQKIGIGEETKLDTKVRNNDGVGLVASEESEWLYRKLTDCVIEINNKFHGYDLTAIEDLMFLSYNKVGHGYASHIDIHRESTLFRKLSFSLQLTDASEYTGSDLLIHGSTVEPIVAKRERGTLNFFPSYIRHEVTPLLTGKRFSLVGWVSGPPFK